MQYHHMESKYHTADCDTYAGKICLQGDVCGCSYTMPNQPKGIEENTPNTELVRIVEEIMLDGADLGSDGNIYWHPEKIGELVKTYAKQEVEKVFEEMIRFTFEACPYEGTMMRAFINSNALLAEKEDLGYCTTCIQMTNHRDSRCLKCLAKKDSGEPDRPINNERE